MKVYYNENDPFAAAWLRELMVEGCIPEGFIDTRSIADVRGEDVKDFDQCHFFAGIGGWAYALELASWRGPVWTGSCPCQPFSAAGQRKGTADARHLWPEFYRLIAECRPERIFGEQVASAIGQGWLDGISADLEAEGYACGAAVLGAHSVGAPHIRQRLYWVADANMSESDGRNTPSREQSLCDGGVEAGGLGNTNDTGLQGRCIDAGECADQRTAGTTGELGGLADSMLAGRSERWPGARSGSSPWGGQSILCTDGKTRVFEPGIFPLAHGVPNRMGTLRGAGNAICPQIGAEFIKAYLDTSAGDVGA